jgi:hypothetical protein
VTGSRARSRSTLFQASRKTGRPRPSNGFRRLPE